MQKNGRDWALFKADPEADYKNLPLDPSDHLYAIVVLRRPAAGIWHSFRSRTLVFGSVAAVLHYNIQTALFRLNSIGYLAFPPICFFDYFAALLPRLLASKGLAVFACFCEVLGDRLKSAKSEMGTAVTFLGALGAFPAKETDLVLRKFPPGEKKAWSAPIPPYLARGGISYQELEEDGRAA